MNLKVKYLGEIEVIFEMALGNESGNQVGSIHEKNHRGRKSRETIPLRKTNKFRTLFVAFSNTANCGLFIIQGESLRTVRPTEV